MILGICAKAGSGKDTLADYLVKNNYFTKISLADPLKRIAKETYDFSDECLWGPSEMRSKPDERYLKPDGIGFLTVREVLISLGTNFGRNLYTSTWSDYLIRQIKTLQSNPHYKYFPHKGVVIDSMGFDMLNRNKDIIVPDVRFLNELNTLKNNKAYVRAGAGIVYDSDPESEFIETENKAKACLAAIGDD